MPISAYLACDHGHVSGGPITALPQFAGSFVVFLLLASCATSTGDERAERMYDREEELIVAREEFERWSVACHRQGGLVENRTVSSSNLRKRRTVHDYKIRQCVSRTVP